MAPLIPIAISLASKFLPSLVGAFKGDKAEERAQQLVGIAQAVTGCQEPEQAVQALDVDPGMAAQFKEKAMDFQLEIYREDTRRLEIVNQTMRAEYETKSGFRGGWRPFWGYVSGTAFGVQIFGLMFLIGWVIMKNPAEASSIIDSIVKLPAALATTWAIALTVLGVAVHKRSKDKQAAAGFEPRPGMLNSLISMIKK